MHKAEMQRCIQEKRLELEYQYKFGISAQPISTASSASVLTGALGQSAVVPVPDWSSYTIPPSSSAEGGTTQGFSDDSYAVPMGSLTHSTQGETFTDQLNNVSLF